MLKKIKWLVIVILAVVAIFAIRNFYRVSPKRISAEKYQQILNEITSVEFSIGSLTPDNSGSTLAYIHAADNGRSLAFLNLKTLERKQIALTNEVTQVNGWSSDDRYLAFVQTLSPRASQTNKFGLRESWMTLFDREKNFVSRLSNGTNVYEQYLMWLNSNNYIYAHRWLTNEYGEIMMGSLVADASLQGRGNNPRKVSNYMPEAVFMSERMSGYLYHGNILSLEIKPLADSDVGTNQSSRTVYQLTDFKPDAFTEMKWLRYSPATSNFLFCAKPTNSNWRYLFEFNSTTKQLMQLSREDTYNGQYFQQGTGYAYVVNTNGGFYLAVRPKDTASRTNLFVDGGVANYTAAPSGDLIYVTASQGTEPQGIWGYNLTNKTLRSLSSKSGRPFVAARPIKPKEFKIKSFDGLEIPCFLLEPPLLAKEKVERPKKYPAVIYAPPTSSQFQKSFDERSQLLANLGFYFLAVNYRGCDGYGKEFSELADTPKAALDILKAREELLKDTHVDSKNIFLCTISGGVAVTLELLATSPKLWRGVTLDKPGEMSGYNEFSPSRLPPMLVITGTDDPAFPSVHKFVLWATENQVEVKSVIHANSGHFTFKVDERKDKLRQTSSFMLDHVK